MARGTLEYVGRAILGISLDTLDTAKENKYADAIREIKCEYACSWLGPS